MAFRDEGKTSENNTGASTSLSDKPTIVSVDNNKSLDIDFSNFNSASTSLASTAVNRSKQQIGYNLLNKFFGTFARAARFPEPIDRQGDNDLEGPNTDPLAMVSEAPFIRPLGHKQQLEPRIEPRRFAKGDPTTTSFSYPPVLQIPEEIARERDRTRRILDGMGVQDDMRGKEKSTEARSDIVDNIKSKASHQIDSTAILEGRNESRAIINGEYLESHSNGKPDGPKQAFTYLHATLPPNEAERQIMNHKFDIWGSWSPLTVGLILRTAMSKMHACFATFSIFDANNEIIKVEAGLNDLHVEHIPRVASLAAHVVLSGQVFVVHDAKHQNFVHNPLVADGQGILFYAGAPVPSSPGGLAFGVLSIYDKQARTKFSMEDRYHLSVLGGAIMEDLKHQASQFSDVEVRHTPILQRDSLICGNHESDDEAETDDGLCPAALRFGKRSTPHLRDLIIFAEQRVLAGQTPPSSSSSSNAPYAGVPLMNHGQSPAEYGGLYPALQNKLLPRPIYTALTPNRPWSGSDITSIRGPPSNTPDVSILPELREDAPTATLPIILKPKEQLSLPTIEDFLKLSDEDVAERLDVDVVPGDTTENPSHVTEMQSLTSEANTLFTEEGQHHPTPMTYSYLTADTSPESTEYASEQLREIKDLPMELKAEVRRITNVFSFDLTYIVKLRPQREAMTDEQLEKPGGMKWEILALSGRFTPPDLSPKAHLQCLRSAASRGYVLWQDSDEFERSDFQSGFLFRIRNEGCPGPVKFRDSGVILGVFRKEAMDKQDTSDALEAAEKLKNIYIKVTQQGQTSITSGPATLDSYPADEAIELGNFSLDASRDHKSRGSQESSKSIESYQLSVYSKPSNRFYNRRGFSGQIYSQQGFSPQISVTNLNDRSCIGPEEDFLDNHEMGLQATCISGKDMQSSCSRQDLSIYQTASAYQKGHSQHHFQTSENQTYGSRNPRKFRI